MTNTYKFVIPSGRRAKPFIKDVVHYLGDEIKMIVYVAT